MEIRWMCETSAFLIGAAEGCLVITLVETDEINENKVVFVESLIS